MASPGALLFGGKVRRGVLEALVEAQEPLTAYTIAQMRELGIKTAY